MMLSGDDLCPSIPKLFLTIEDEPKTVLFQNFISWSGKDLPEYFENFNYLTSLFKNEDHSDK